MTVFEELHAMQKRLDFYDLAKRVASGEGVTATDILESCRLADKPTTSFEQLVSTIQRREALREEYTTLPDIIKQIEQLQAKVDAENDKLEAAVEAHRAATAPLQSQIEATRSKKHEVEQIPTNLVRQCPHEQLLAQYNRVNGNRHNADFQSAYNGPSEMELRKQCLDY